MSLGAAGSTAPQAMKKQTRLRNVAPGIGLLLLSSACSTPPSVPDLRDSAGEVPTRSDVRPTLLEEISADDGILVETFHGTVLLRGLVEFDSLRGGTSGPVIQAPGADDVPHEVVAVHGVCTDMTVQDDRRDP